MRSASPKTFRWSTVNANRANVRRAGEARTRLPVNARDMVIKVTAPMNDHGALDVEAANYVAAKHRPVKKPLTTARTIFSTMYG
jgi:hypothetical protein